MRANKTMKKVLSILLCLCMVLQYVPTTAFAADTAEGGLCEHHTEHTAECGYAAAGAQECHYECAECAAASESEEPSEESYEPAPVCDCGTDDPAIHATTCAVYVAPENPQCFCAEKCAEANVWCDICGVDYTKCGGTDTAVTWAAVDLSCNTSSFGNDRGTWRLNPDNAATEFYNLIDDNLIGGYSYVPDKTYITTNAFDYRDGLGNDGFLWTDCKNQTIQDGKYYIYVFTRSASQINRIEYIVDVQLRYTVNISVTGAPSGYGGVTLNGSNAGSPQYLQKGSNITLTVKDVPSHKHTVTFDTGVTCMQNGDTYAFSNVNKSFTFKVVYEADEFATVSFGQPEGATISVNGNSTSPVQVIAGMPYTVSVKANDGYYLTGITVDGTTTGLDTTSYNKNLTAGANGAGHTISVTTAQIEIPVHTTASITYTKNQDKASLITAIKDAVYAGSDNNTKNSLTVNYPYYGNTYIPILDSTDIWESVLTAGELFSCNVKESVSIKLSSGDVYSQSCTLYLYDGDISAKGEIKKDYTEDPVKLDGNDFNCACPANFTSSYPAEYRYYTESGQRLSSAPTEVGKYQVQVKASSYYKANPDAIIGTSWTSWSDLIPFEIVSVPSYSITVENSADGHITASKETSIAGKTITLTVEPDVGYVVDTVAYNGTPITPVEGVYSFTMPAGAVTISATFKACTHSGGTATCKEQAVCTVCGESYGEVDKTNHEEEPTYQDNGDGTHSADYPCCGTNGQPEPHTMDTATGKCQFCEQEMAEAYVTTGGATTYYEWLMDAISAVNTATAADNATVTLLKDNDAGQSIYGGVFTLDLNGKTLSSETFKTALNIYSATVAITDTLGGGGITGREQGVDARFSTLTITDTTITATDATGLGVVAQNCTAVTIRNATVSGVSQGVNATSCNVLTITDAAITATDDDGYGVNATDCAEATIEGSTISGGYIGVNAYGGNLMITDAEITGSGESSYAVDANGCTEVTIEGSTIDSDGTDGDGMNLYNCTNAAIKDTHITASGIRGRGVIVENCTLTIQDCTVTGGNIGVVAYTNSSVSFENSTVTAKEAVCSVGGEIRVSGGSVNGSVLDLVGNAKLILPADGVGTTFPGGIVVEGTTLQEVLDEGAAYWQGSRMIVPADDQREITGGDVAIKAACDHNGNTNKPTNNGNGTHSIICTVCGVTVTGEHTATYSASGSVITESCSECNATIGTATITAENATYHGMAQETATVTYSNGWTGSELTISYENNVNAGTATASITVGEATARVDFTIAKADTVIAAAPTPNTLTYTGEAKYLISQGEAVGGTMVYSLSENGDYTTTIPQGTAAGEYTVYYKVVGDANHSNTTVDSVKVTIAKAQAEITVDTAPITVTYGETVTLPSAATNFGTVVCDKTAADLVNAGTYTVTYTVEGTANYEGAEKKLTVTVEKKAVAEPTVTGNYTYTGSEQTVQLTGMESCMKFTSGNKATNAGNYEVVVTLDGNHKWADGADGKLRWSIAKAQAVITVDTAPITVTYGETVTLPGAATNFGTVVCDKTAADLVNAGTYTVTYTVEGTANYEGAEKKLTVTVEKRAVAEPTVTGNYTYTGSEQTAQLTGVESCMKFTSGNKGTNAGNYEVVVTLDGNHKWADGADGKLRWSIAKAQAEITVDTTPITVTYGETVTLPGAATNFGTVVCDKTADDLVNAGTYTVTYTVEGTANYDGDTKTVTVTVNPKAITAADVKLNGSLTYNGKEQTQSFTVTEGITYAVNGNKATDAGTYVLTVAGTGNYTGSLALDWTIAKAKLTITADSKVIYIGEKLPALTCTVSGLVGSDRLTVEPVLTTNADTDQAGSYTITAADADAGNNYTITYVGGSLTIMDKETEVETKVEQGELTQVPDDLKDTRFDTVEEITEELISKIVTTSSGYSAENMEHYDVSLHFSLDGGDSWILATEENFPAEGITVVLPYPEGTNPRDYEFVVSSMSTVTSQRLGTVAGEVAMPQAEKTESGIRVTLKSPSIVTLATKYHAHTGGTATCTDRAICDLCGNAYGEPDATNHVGETEVRNAVGATCGTQGYTGDIHCKGCGGIVEKGTAIKATGEHAYGEWRVVVAPTSTTKGEKQRVCSVCDHVGFKEIPVLSHTPATGDDSHIMLYGAAFMVSLTGIAVFLAARKRKQENA
ncbi:MAG: right-handed parallel beta-helix repeat-containing protein [Oscillospiraceae bacterium]|nr:right-handed parallel beta-helix repeat-containing protein [Oscillospiraceae bacterium]